MQIHTLKCASRQFGLTLVEILVAVLVISIGLLGVAGLHAYSLRNNHDALMRSHASALASDIADRMRTNRQAALDGNYNLALSDGPPTLTATSPRIDVDRSEWLQTIAATLPNGDGAVVVNPTSRMATITVQWGERGTSISFRAETEI